MCENFLRLFCPKCGGVLKVGFLDFLENKNYLCACGSLLKRNRQRALIDDEKNVCKWSEDCFRKDCVMSGGGYYPNIYFSEDGEIFCLDYCDKYCLIKV